MQLTTIHSAPAKHSPQGTGTPTAWEEGSLQYSLLQDNTATNLSNLRQELACLAGQTPTGYTSDQGRCKCKCRVIFENVILSHKNEFVAKYVILYQQSREPLLNEVKRNMIKKELGALRLLNPEVPMVSCLD